MMKHIIFKQVILVSCLLLSACNKEDDLTLVDFSVSGESWEPTVFDHWLDESLRVPYNIAVGYRWNQYIFVSEELRKSLVPPDTSSARQVMSAILECQITPYERVMGRDFVLTYIPKSYVLVGSYSWNSNGTITLGLAEGAKQVMLFGINNYNRQEIADVENVLRTCHHEFAHILHQTHAYPKEFKNISAGNYTANWSAIDGATPIAHSLGFISAYARKDPDEDFVEMIAHMLIWGKERYEQWVTDLLPVEARNTIRKKEAIVIKYYADTYHVDFEILQAATQRAIDDYLNLLP